MIRKTLLVPLGSVWMMSSTFGAAQQPKVQVSAWYWLNSAPKTEWESDFPR